MKKKQILSILLVAIMLCSLFPTGVFAAEEDPAQTSAAEQSEVIVEEKEARPETEPVEVGGETPGIQVDAEAETENVAKVTYDTYEEDFSDIDSAWAAVLEAGTEEVTLKLLNDVTVDKQLALRTGSGTTDTTERKLTIDLNNFSITCTAKYKIFLLNKNGKMTIIGNGNVTSSNATKQGLCVLNNGAKAFEVRGGTYSLGSEMFSGTSKSNAKIYGGTFDVDPSAYVASGYEAVGNDPETPTSWTVQEAKKCAQIGEITYFTLEDAIAAAAAASKTGSGSLVTVKLLDDVEVASYIKIAASGDSSNPTIQVKLDLNGKNITLTGSASRLFTIPQNCTFTISGSGTVNAADKLICYFNSKSSAHLRIEGGTYTGTNAKPLQSSSENTVVDAIITGGSFSFDPTAYAPMSHRVVNTGTEEAPVYAVSQVLSTDADAEVAILPTGAETPVFNTVEKAFSAVWTGEATLLKSATVNTPLAVDENSKITLDLKGSTITGAFTADNRLFTVNGELTVKDSASGGELIGTATCTKSGSVCFVQSTGKLTIQSGKLTGLADGSAVFAYKSTKSDAHGTVTITGGTVIGTVSSSTPAEGQTYSQYVAISGGWFSDSVSKYADTDAGFVGGVKVADEEHSDAPYTVTKTNDGTIEYYANGGIQDSMPKNQPDEGGTLSYLESYTVTVKSRTMVPVKADSIFAGWNTAEDGSGTAYESGAEIPLTDTDHNIKLYAQWTPVSVHTAAIGETTYATIGEALYRANAEDEIDLIADANEKVTVYAGKNITIDLNSHSITGSGTGSAITVQNGAQLKIMDSVGNGYVYGEAQKSGGAVDNAGFLTLDGGTLKGFAPNYGAGVYNSGTFTIKKGSVIAVQKPGDEGLTGSEQAIYSTSASTMVTIEGADCSVTGSLGGDAAKYTIKAGTFSADPSGYLTGTYYAKVTDNGYIVLSKPADFGNATVSATISLQDSIAVNLYVKGLTDESEDAASHYYVSTEFMGNEVKGTLSELKTAGTAEYIEAEGAYRMTIAQAAASEMNETVSILVQFSVDGETFTELVDVSYSVAKYCENQINKSGDADLVAVCKATMDYGAYCAKYFDNVAIGEGVADLSNVVVPEKKAAVSGSCTGIKARSASVSFESATQINIYFETENKINGYSFTVNDTEATAEPVNETTDRYVVRITGIGAPELGKDYVVKVTDGTDTLSVTYSPMVYCYSKQSSASADMVNVTRAMYAYYEAANAAFNQVTE